MLRGCGPCLQKGNPDRPRRPAFPFRKRMNQAINAAIVAPEAQGKQIGMHDGPIHQASAQTAPIPQAQRKNILSQSGQREHGIRTGAKTMADEDAQAPKQE